MKIIYLILLIALAIFIATFAQFNSTAVHITYYKYFEFDVPAYLLIFICFLAGIIIGGFWGVVERFRLNRTISRLNRKVREMRNEMRTSGEHPPIIEPKDKSVTGNERGN